MGERGVRLRLTLTAAAAVAALTGLALTTGGVGRGGAGGRSGVGPAGVAGTSGGASASTAAGAAPAGSMAAASGEATPADAGGAAPSVGAAAPSGATRLVAVAPTRLFDSRLVGPAPADGSTLRIPVGPVSPTPSGATAAVVNVTVTAATGPGYVTVWPGGAPRPLASNLNVARAGQTVANLVVVPLGALGDIAVYQQRGAHVVVDLVGAFVPSDAAAAGRVVPQRPERVLDTRTAGGALAPGALRTVDLGERARRASAAVVNLTVTEPLAPGYVTAWADGAPRPTTSNVNVDRAGQTVANLALVPLRDGRMTVSAFAGTHLVVDLAALVTGDADPVGTDGLFVPLDPVRVVDTREARPIGRLTGGYRADLPLAGAGGVPSEGVAAVLVNATATETSLPGFVTLYPAGTERPLASNLNADESWQTVPNLVLARLGPTGAASVLPQHTGHLVVDALGWFTGPAAAADPGVAATAPAVPAPVSGGRLEPAGAISGQISPKSVVVTGGGLVFAQNMMYTHTVTVYDRAGTLLETIPDRVDLAAFGVGRAVQQGAPVEGAVAPDGRHVYVSNYSMYGPGAGREGFDDCTPADGVGESTVYRIDVATLSIDQVIPVGRVPKFLTVTPDGRWLVVSNWCGDDVSIVDTTTGAEVRRVRVGRYPRGLAAAADSRTVYVALMGENRLAVVDVLTGDSRWTGGVGGGPRHLNLSPDGRWLYVTLNADGAVAKVDVASMAVVARVATGTQPRSASLAPDGRHLYVVNYESASASRIRTEDFTVDAVVSTAHHPIGIAYDGETRQLFVACYDGRILLFDER